MAAGTTTGIRSASSTTRTSARRPWPATNVPVAEAGGDPVRGPVAELRAFLDAALLVPVRGQHGDPPEARTRRRVVVAVTFVVGSAVLAWALRIRPGDPLFYTGSIALAAVWGLRAGAPGPPPLLRPHT